MQMCTSIECVCYRYTHIVPLHWNITIFIDSSNLILWNGQKMGKHNGCWVRNDVWRWQNRFIIIIIYTTNATFIIIIIYNTYVLSVFELNREDYCSKCNKLNASE